MRSLLTLLICVTCITASFSQQFTEIDPGIVGINQGNVMWGDYDNDGDLDAFVFGGDANFGSNSSLFRNDQGVFTEVFPDTFTSLLIGDSDWGDFDNDGDLDIILSGSIDSSPAGGRTILYQNNGDGFTAIETAINNFLGGAVSWGDFDNDGDLDLAIGGEEAADGSNNPRNIEIYENTATGFLRVYQELNTGITLGSVDWGDYDQDGDLDLLLTGFSSTATSRRSSIIDNTSDGFSRNTAVELIGVASGSGKWGDYDNDGDLDILLNGSTFEEGVLDRQTLIYQNTANEFALVFEDVFIGTEEGEADWGDFDSDGDLDILVIGRGSDDFDDLNAKIYENTGSGFTELEDLTTGVRIGSAAWGDFENDGDLDILLAGQDAESNTITRIYRNTDGSNSYTPNTSPTAPTELSTTTTSGNVSISWSKATDNETPQEGLTYNIQLRTGDGDTLISAQSRTSGLRKVVKRGNMQFQTSLDLALDPGNYSWKVQAIDHSFQGSAFSSEESFAINFPPVITGTSSSLTTPEEASFTIAVQDLAIDDPDNVFPTDYTLTVFEGENYTLSGNEITPATDFNGTLSVSVQVNDGTDDSEVAVISIEVSPVNDVPVITSFNSTYLTPEETVLTINVEDFSVQDPDNEFPTDFSLTALAGDNYTVSGNQITPAVDFFGALSVMVVINDGADTSDPFTIPVEVTQVLGLSDPFITENFLVYPNPASEFLKVQPINEVQDFEIKIFSLKGSLIKSFGSLQEESKLDISSIESGNYFLQISTPRETGRFQFFKR